MIHKVRINKKYPFKQMSPGETLKLTTSASGTEGGLP